MTRKQKRMTIAAGALVIAGLGVGLILSALNSSVAYFYTPSQLAALTTPPHNMIRLGGLVVTGSVKSDAANSAEIVFRIRDEIAETPVSYTGILPDLFREGQGVIVQGHVRKDGGIEATEVLAKHDETYMPREVADALKEQGRWRESATPDQ